MTRQITDQLRSLIGSGALAVGSLLPSERTLRNPLGVARNDVVRGSYEYLEKAASLTRQQTADCERAASDQTSELVVNLSGHRVDTFSVDADLESHSIVLRALGWRVF